MQDLQVKELGKPPFPSGEGGQGGRGLTPSPFPEGKGRKNLLFLLAEDSF